VTDEPLDTHYEIALDEEPDRRPVYVDVVAREHQRRPIIPASVRPANLAGTVRYHAGRTAHRVGYHAVRAVPVYLPKALFWALVGVFRVAGRQIRWWWVVEQHQLRQDAATRNDPDVWMRLHAEAKATRAVRGTVLAAELVGIIVLVAVLQLLPWWATVVTVAVAVPFLAHAGRPVDRRIVEPAIVTPRYRRLNPDIVLRAYYAAKLGDPEKRPVRFGGPMARDPQQLGSQVVVDLDYGYHFADVIKAKAALASGLDVTSNQVFLTRDRSSDRRHLLYVADVDPLAIPAGRTPLLAGKVTDIWAPAPFGLDERGRRVAIPLMWISVLVGAQPRKGKTFSARLLALYAALDPYVRLTVVDGKNSPDWDKFRLVAHRTVFGTHPNPRCHNPIDELVEALEEIAHHIRQVNDLLSKLPASECPEGKLTRDLARRYPQLRVWLLVMEEFQVYFETDDQDVNKQIAGLLSFIMAVGPSAGVIILSSSQKPSGVGAGDVSRLFNRYRDNHSVRFALKCGNRVVSEAVLGGDAYAEGFDASALPTGEEYRGVGYLYGLTDETPTVRTYLATAEDAERILLAARAHRETAGTLTGQAAGEDMGRQVRDVLRDVDSVFRTGEAWVSWQALAARMAEQMPEHYADLTGAAISAQVRALGAAARKGRDEAGASVWGVPRAEVATAIQRREIEGRR
jgi:DNA segregation ATPase FtsK/SpoIIIE, S-DNA-T family